MVKATKITRLIANPLRTLYPSRTVRDRRGRPRGASVYRVRDPSAPCDVKDRGLLKTIAVRSRDVRAIVENEEREERRLRSSPHRVVRVFRRDNGIPFERKRTATRGDARGAEREEEGRGEEEGKSVRYSEASTYERTPRRSDGPRYGYARGEREEKKL